MSIVTQDGVSRRPVVIRDGQIINVSEVYSVEAGIVSKVFNPPLPLWTPNFNGVNSYLRFPAIILANNFKITITTNIGHYKNMAILGSKQNYNEDEMGLFVRSHERGTPRPVNVFEGNSGGVSPNGTSLFMNLYQDYSFEIIRSGSEVKYYAEGVLMHTSTTAFPTMHDLETMGGLWDVNEIIYELLGTIKTFKYDDIDNNSNSREYELVLRSNDMPTSIVVVDKLGDGSTNGTMINFGTDQPWVQI